MACPSRPGDRGGSPAIADGQMLNDGVRKNGEGARGSGTDRQERAPQKTRVMCDETRPHGLRRIKQWTTNSAAFPFLRAKLSVGWESGDEGRRTRRSPHPLRSWPQISITMQI